MWRALAGIAGAGIVALSPLAPAARAGSGTTVLTYSIREARAYAFKVSLSKQELQLIPPCDPQTDPYGCDTSTYNHTLNCPPEIALGRTKPGPEPDPESSLILVSGDAAGTTGVGPPNQSSPVRLNRLESLGSLSSIGGFDSAEGFASDEYVDLSGRNTPEAHTQSEAFSNLPDYEERCYPETNGSIDQTSYEHFLSRSTETPGTYHLSECFGSACTLGHGVTVEHALELVDLHQSGDVVTARARSVLQGVRIAQAGLDIDALVSYAEVRSDGTTHGYTWSVATSVAGAKIAGVSVAIPAGRFVTLGGVAMGIAQPYVAPSHDGHETTMVVPGLQIGSDPQALLLGGTEIYATFDRVAPAPFVPITLPHPFTVPPVLPRIVPPPPVTQTIAPPPPVTAAAPRFAIRTEQSGAWGIVALLAAGAAGLAVLVLRWSQRWAWGAALARRQPLRGVDWLYRAFVKT